MIYRCNEFESRLFDPFADVLPELDEVTLPFELPLELPELAELSALPDLFEVLDEVLFEVLVEALVEVLDAVLDEDSCEFVTVALVSAACAV